MPKIFALRDRLIRAQSILAAEVGDEDRYKQRDSRHAHLRSEKHFLDNDFEDPSSIFGDLDGPRDYQGKSNPFFQHKLEQVDWNPSQHKRTPFYVQP